MKVEAINKTIGTVKVEEITFIIETDRIAAKLLVRVEVPDQAMLDSRLAGNRVGCEPRNIVEILKWNPGGDPEFVLASAPGQDNYGKLYNCLSSVQCFGDEFVTDDEFDEIIDQILGVINDLGSTGQETEKGSEAERSS